MKLKKIASLMLAGVMAVSMLTACNTTSNDNDDNQDDDIVIPVDDSFAVDINNELNTAQKNTLTITADSDLEAMLNRVSDKVDSYALQQALATAQDGFGFVLNTQSSVAEDMRHLMGLDDTASLTIYNSNWSKNPTGDANANDPAAPDQNWKYFKSTADSVNTTLDLIVADADYTDEGLAHKVADELVALMTANRLPGEGTASSGKDYDCDYTGHVACVKVDNLRGDNAYYVIALEITQTPTEVVNV